jgi:hypothetical protein
MAFLSASARGNSASELCNTDPAGIHRKTEGNAV